MKTQLKEDALLELLNWELAAYDECAGCHFTRLERAGEEWVDAKLEADHSLDTAERFIARQVVTETRQVFGVA
jgi:hypothetical protein